MNLKGALPSQFAASEARFNALKASVQPKAEATADVMGVYEWMHPSAGRDPPVCQRMHDTYAGFFGPWAGTNAT